MYTLGIGNEINDKHIAKGNGSCQKNVELSPSKDVILSNSDLELSNDCFIIHFLNVLLRKIMIENCLNRESRSKYSALMPHNFNRKKNIQDIHQHIFIRDLLIEKKKLLLLCKKVIGLLKSILPEDVNIEEFFSQYNEVGKSKTQSFVPQDQFSKENTIYLIKEMTIRSLEPNIEILIHKHNRKIRELNSLHQFEINELENKIKSSYSGVVRSLEQKFDYQLKYFSNNLQCKSLQESKKIAIRINDESERSRSEHILQLKSKIAAIRKELRDLKIILTDQNDELIDLNQNIHIFLKKLKVRLTEEVSERCLFYLQRLMRLLESKCEQILEIKHKLNENIFDHTISQELFKLKKERDEEIENIIFKLEQNFNDEKHKLNMRNERKICKLKEEYEHKLNQLINTSQATIQSAFPLEFKNDLVLKLGCYSSDVHDSLIKNNISSDYQSANDYDKITYERISYLEETIEQLKLENTHLKNYIRKIDIQKDN